jgi:hypothetical protein
LGEPGVFGHGVWNDIWLTIPTISPNPRYSGKG